MLTEFILEDNIMKTLLSCEFNMDTGCVELKILIRRMDFFLRLLTAITLSKMGI